MIVDIETAFKTVFGRSPTTAERRRLAYLSASWAVDGNEALIAVLFVLELGAGFREYPARCAESVRRAVRYVARQNGTAASPAVRSHQTPLAGVWALLTLVSVAIIGLHAGASQKLVGTLDMTLPVAATLTTLLPLVALMARRLGRLRRRVWR